MDVLVFLFCTTFFRSLSTKGVWAPSLETVLQTLSWYYFPLKGERSEDEDLKRWNPGPRFAGLSSWDGLRCPLRDLMISLIAVAAFPGSCTTVYSYFCLFSVSTLEACTQTRCPHVFSSHHRRSLRQMESNLWHYSWARHKNFRMSWDFFIWSLPY